MRSPYLASLLLLLVGSRFALAQREVTELVPSDPTGNAFFGAAVAIEGSTAVMGARQDNPTGQVIGAAYVFDLSQGVWQQRQKLLPLVPQFGMQFGASVAITGEWIFVGAPNEDTPGLNQSGAVYVFHRQGGAWLEVQRLVASNASSSSFFGYPLKAWQDQLIVGAPQASSLAFGGGTAYVFELQGSLWLEVAKLTPSDPMHGDVFGTSVAIRGDTALVGAPFSDGPPVDSGAAYVFERSAAGWVQTQKLVIAQGQSFMAAGQSVAIAENDLLVGAPSFSGSFGYQGAVFAFERLGAGWVQTQTIVANDPQFDLFFASDLDAHGSRMLAGCPIDSDHGYASGSAYLFVKRSTAWIQAGKVLAHNTSINDMFGTGVGLDGSMAIIGAPATDWACPSTVTCNSGSAYIFDLPSDSEQYCSCPAPAGPCGNHDDHGGCRNSGGHGAVLSAAGTGAHSADDFQLVCQWLPPSTPSLLFMGGGTAQLPFGDGRLCVSAGPYSVQRFLPVLSSVSGVAAFGPGLSGHALSSFPRIAQLVPGRTWNFQVWYRDPAGPCASVTNLSNAVSVTLRP